MPNRRALLLAPLLALPAPARGTEDDAPGRRPPRLPTPRAVRLRPGAAPVRLDAAIGAGGQAPLTLRFTGEGAPATVFRLPSWYGNARVFAVLPLRGREVVLAAFEGNTGTGVYQELQAVIGQEDDGTARILALETLHARETAVCDEASYLTVRATPLADGGALRLDHFARGVSGACGPPSRRPRRFREEWASVLRWSGRGAMVAPAPRAGAGPGQRLVEAARAKTAAWLAAAPRSEVTLDDVQALGLMEVLRRG